MQAIFIDVQPGKDGVTYGNRCGFALETQYFPDTIHHENFPLLCIWRGRTAENTILLPYISLKHS